MPTPDAVKRTQAVIGGLREENKRLRDLNSDMLAALKVANRAVGYALEAATGQGFDEDFLMDRCLEASEAIDHAISRAESTLPADRKE